MCPLGLLDGVVDGELEDVRHRGYRISDVLTHRHEYGVDEVLRRELRLAHETAQSARAACPAKSLYRKWHGITRLSWLYRGRRGGSLPRSLGRGWCTRPLRHPRADCTCAPCST